ncbi:MAG: hypothetical protein L0Z62_05135 [Gemmataceae bacterium]|nr:hypothetical protein [Gemmataceae bacterium]
MPFNFMLWYALSPGKTSYQEPGTGWGVQVKPQKDETILFHLTDSQQLRDHFKSRNWYDLKNVADLLVFCNRPGRDVILLFVELKGSDIEHAAGQIRQLVDAVRKALPNPMRKETDYRALILASGSAPAKKVHALQKEFREKHQIELHVRTGIKKGASVDLRPFLKD